MQPRHTWLLLLLLTAIRLLTAAWTPLSPDEAYYWVWSRALAPGYLDHPPMVALWIWFGTWLLGDTTLGVRLLGPLAAAAGSVLLARAAEDLFPGQRRGVPAAVLLNATLLLGVGAVTMTPDTPLILFWTASVAALARLHRTGNGAWWLAAGLAAGLALASKYTAALLGVGIVLWVVAIPGQRRWLLTAPLWAGGLLAAAVFGPVVWWNAGHGWAGFIKQGGRVGDWNPSRALGNMGELVVGQLGLATPLVFVLLAAGTFVAGQRALRRDPAWTLLAALILPGLAVFVQHAIGDRVQANWPAIVYPAAAIAGAALGWRLWRPAAALGLALTGLVYLQSAAAPFALPRRLDPTLIRLGGWDDVVRDLEGLRLQAGADFVASESYGAAALLAFGNTATPILGAEPRWSYVRLQPGAGAAGVLLATERRSEPPDPAVWATADRIGRIVRARNGVEAEAYRVYRVTLQPGASTVRLPQGGR